jgi:hypothetical protein
MFGKLFKSAFTGSMHGKGPEVFAVWAYVIAHADEGSYVELNPEHLGPIIGMAAGEIGRVIKEFCEPDPKSRSQEEGGRKLIFEGGYQYRVVNHAKYRAICSQEERRAYFREQKRLERERKKEGKTGSGRRERGRDLEHQEHGEDNPVSGVREVRPGPPERQKQTVGARAREITESFRNQPPG